MTIIPPPSKTELIYHTLWTIAFPLVVLLGGSGGRSARGSSGAGTGRGAGSSIQGADLQVAARARWSSEAATEVQAEATSLVAV